MPDGRNFTESLRPKQSAGNRPGSRLLPFCGIQPPRTGGFTFAPPGSRGFIDRRKKALNDFMIPARRAAFMSLEHFSLSFPPGGIRHSSPIVRP